MRPLFIALILSFAFFNSAHAEPVQLVKADNGVSAWLVEDHSLPVISVTFAWRHGVELDPEKLEGLSYLSAHMLSEGAGADDANAFQKKLDDNAISLSFAASRDQTSGSVRSLKETWPLAAAMVREAVQNPRFDKDALAREKAQSLNAIRAYKSDPDWLLTRMAFAQLFKNHPYGKRTLGTENSVNAITREDAKGWHALLGKAHPLVAATGDITPDELKKMLVDVFGAKKEDAQTPSLPEWTLGESGAAGKTWLYKHPGTQSNIMMVWGGMKRSDPQWEAAEVMNYILGGGGFSSRLTNEIREKRGLTYGISTGMMDFDHAQLYTLEATSKNADAATVMELAKAEIARMVATPVSAEELQAAKDYLIGAYPLQLTSTARVAAHYLQLQLDGLPMDEREKREAALKAVSAADVQAVAKRLLASSPAVFLVGEPEGIKDAMVVEKVE